MGASAGTRAATSAGINQSGYAASSGESALGRDGQYLHTCNRLAHDFMYLSSCGIDLSRPLW